MGAPRMGARKRHIAIVGGVLHDHGHGVGQRREQDDHAPAGVGLMSRRLAPGVLTLLCALLAFAAPAHAVYGPAAGGLGAEIVSVDNASDEQGTRRRRTLTSRRTGICRLSNASDELLRRRRRNAERTGSGGTARDRAEGGIFRYDRVTGQLLLVASGNLVVSEGPEAGKSSCVAPVTHQSAPKAATSRSQAPRSSCPRTPIAALTYRRERPTATSRCTSATWMMFRARRAPIRSFRRRTRVKTLRL